MTVCAGPSLTLRCSYARPLRWTGGLTALCGLGAWATAPDGWVFWFFVYVVFVSGMLLVAFALAQVLDFLRLTVEGFSIPLGKGRATWRWADIDSFFPVETRLLGVREHAVGWNTADDPDAPVLPTERRRLEERRRRRGADFFLHGRYGGLKPRELANLLNEWRVRYTARASRVSGLGS